MAVTYVADQNNTVSNRALSLALGTLAVGDVIVVVVYGEQNATAYRPGAPSVSGVTFTLQNSETSTTLGQFVWVASYKGTVTTAGAKTITCAGTTTAGIHGALAGAFPAADGFSIAAFPSFPNAGIDRGSGVGATTVTTAGDAGSVVIWGSGDWNAVSGASRTLRASNTDRFYEFATGKATHYGGSLVTTGPGSYNIGVTTPAAQKWALVWIEVPLTAPIKPPNFFPFM